MLPGEQPELLFGLSRKAFAKGLYLILRAVTSSFLKNKKTKNIYIMLRIKNQEYKNSKFTISSNSLPGKLSPQ